MCGIATYHKIDLLLCKPVFQQRKNTAAHPIHRVRHPHLTEVGRYDTPLRGNTGKVCKFFITHPLEIGLFYVRPFLERMIRLAQHQHPCPNITLSILEAREDLIVFADENLIAQVVTNLLKNAIQAIGNAPDGKITLKAYCDPQESIRIEIANNGPAIPPDAAGQIFVPFFTTKEEGSGIGLSLSKQIMRLSGGTLTLLPYKEKGQATVFVLVFN